MERLNPQSRKDVFGSKINRSHSPAMVIGLPWITVLLGSLAPLLPIIPPIPIVPPLGFILLIAWRLQRPGILPLWAGFPLGLFDDIFSGQPFGCGILLFSLALIGLQVLEQRFPWRGFWQDWATAIALIAAYLLAAALFSGGNLAVAQFGMLVPQLLLSIVAFPLIAHIISTIDRIRLSRWRRIG